MMDGMRRRRPARLIVGSRGCRAGQPVDQPRGASPRFPRKPDASASRLISWRGFTVVELLIVTMVVGILAALVAPSFHRSLTHHRAEAAAMRVVADLELARRRAQATSSPRTVSFVLDAGRYTLPGVEDFDRPEETYRIELSAAPFHAVLEAVEFSDADDADVQFNGYGLPDSGGTIVVSAGAHRRTVVLDPHTGRATVQ